MTGALSALRADLIAALSAALADLAPSALVERALPPLPPKRARVRVVAAGKAALAMMEGARSRWGERIEDALVVTTESAEESSPWPRARVIRAAHPIPDARSLEAAEEALRRASDLGRDDLLLALISGGASALLALPPEGLRLEQKQAVVAALLESGAPIADVNLVRRHLSRVKGGRLAAAAAPARVLSLLVSDVIGGAPHDIGSGPTAVDPTSVEGAARVLRERAPALVLASPEILRHLSESLKPGPGAPRMRTSILADPDILARAVAALLGARAGLRARALPAEQGDAAAAAERRVEIARRLAPGEAVVIPCEPTLTLPSHRGRGGRAGWVALAAMRALPADVVLLCAATDGVDGSGGTAGAAVTKSDASSVTEAAIDEALAAYNDAPLHEALGTSLRGGATGHNLTDIHVAARLP
jgi:hydroxypyruvate reductase